MHQNGRKRISVSDGLAFSANVYWGTKYTGITEISFVLCIDWNLLLHLFLS